MEARLIVLRALRIVSLGLLPWLVSPSPLAVGQGHADGVLSTDQLPATAGVPLAELVATARTNNPEIQAARYQARAMHARVPQVAALPDPQLMTTVFFESIQTAAGPQEVMLSLSQRFPWFGKLDARAQMAYYDAMAAYARLETVELEVIERVKLAYYDLYYQANATRETRALQTRLDDVLAIARSKFEGNVPGAGLESVYQVQIELSRLKTTLIQLQQGTTMVQAQLAGALHLPSETRIDAVGQFDRTPITLSVERLIEVAQSRHPELIARRREICRDRASVDLACRNYWPDVTLSVNWYEVGGSGLSPVANGEDAYSATVGVNLPLRRTRLDAAVREARNKASQSARRYTAQQDKVQAEVRALYAQFGEHDQVLDILESEILPRAEETLKLSVEAYRQNKLNFQQLFEVYRNLLKYRIDYHKRKAMREQIIASLERAVGCAADTWPIEPVALLEPMVAPRP